MMKGFLRDLSSRRLYFALSRVVQEAGIEPAGMSAHPRPCISDLDSPLLAPHEIRMAAPWLRLNPDLPFPYLYCEGTTILFPPVVLFWKSFRYFPEMNISVLFPLIPYLYPVCSFGDAET